MGGATLWLGPRSVAHKHDLKPCAHEGACAGAVARGTPVSWWIVALIGTAGERKWEAQRQAVEKLSCGGI